MYLVQMMEQLNRIIGIGKNKNFIGITFIHVDLNNDREFVFQSSKERYLLLRFQGGCLSQRHQSAIVVVLQSQAVCFQYVTG